MFVISLDGKTLLGARFIRRYILRVQQRNERLYHPARGTVSSLIKSSTVNTLNKHPPSPPPHHHHISIAFFHHHQQHFYSFFSPNTTTFPLISSTTTTFLLFFSTTATTFLLLSSTTFNKRLQSTIISLFCSNVSCSEEQSWFSPIVSCLSSSSAPVSLPDRHSTITACISPSLIQYT